MTIGIANGLARDSNRLLQRRTSQRPGLSYDRNINLRPSDRRLAARHFLERRDQVGGLNVVTSQPENLLSPFDHERLGLTDNGAYFPSIGLRYVAVRLPILDAQQQRLNPLKQRVVKFSGNSLTLGLAFFHPFVSRSQPDSYRYCECLRQEEQQKKNYLSPSHFDCTPHRTRYQGSRGVLREPLHHGLAALPILENRLRQ